MADDLQLLEQLAAGLEDDPAFIAWALARFRAQEPTAATIAALAERLRLSRLSLARLSLCKRPGSAASDFAARVREIAAFVSVDAAELAALLRQVEFLERLPAAESERGDDAGGNSGNVVPFPKTTAAPPPLLAAARDREEPAANDPSLSPPPLADETR